MRKGPGRRSRHLAAVLLPALLLALPASAQEPEKGLVHSMMKGLGFKTDPRPVQDFVRQSRPAPGTTDYIPVGRKPGDRPVQLRDQQGIAALEAEMAAAKARHDAARAAAPVKKPAPSAQN